jgi:hypothetical protein
MQESIVHGFKVKYEENAAEGIKYLRDDLDSQESRVFFEQARAKKFAEFEDDDDREFTLERNVDGTYVLIRRNNV